jgi:Tfp pilus assembly protein PilV
MRRNSFQRKLSDLSAGFTLLEVLAMSLLLTFFLLSFYEGSMRLSVAMLSQQNRSEAVLHNVRLGERWRAGSDISAVASGSFINGTAFTVGQSSSSSSGLERIAITVGWGEPGLDNTPRRSQYIKDVYLRY